MSARLATALDFPAGLSARVVRLAELHGCAFWRNAFVDEAKDHRWHELVAETLQADFDCRVLLLERDGRVVTLQTFFFVEQDLAATAAQPLKIAVTWLRRVFPSFLQLRMLMAGCPAGEGKLAKQTIADPEMISSLCSALWQVARDEGAPLLVWKDFPARYRSAMQRLALGAWRVGSRRLASMPATRLPLDFTTFEEFLQHRLSHAMRKNLRRKFRALDTAPPIEMEVVSTVTNCVAEVHALYAQVLARSPLQFEKLTPEFFVRLGEMMPDCVRFFLWRQSGRLVAFSLCLVHKGVLYDEYLGLDYRVALELHLYFVTFRDVLTWALAQGLREYLSTPLNYDPKLHLGFELAPLDLYVAHHSRFLNVLLHAALPWFAPTRAEPLLRRFANADYLDG